jgi:hypothetical protein
MYLFDFKESVVIKLYCFCCFVKSKTDSSSAV